VFTGLVEGLGKVKSVVQKAKGFTVEIEPSFSLDDTKIGDSIAVDGACLTVTNLSKNSFFAEVSPETLKRTTLKTKKVGDFVNLERALRLGDRLGGHLVSGHIDGIGVIKDIKKLQDFFKIKVELPKELSIYTVEKGSIAIDGISLTINKVFENSIELMIIPHTFEVTTLKFKKVGDLVNVEVDMIAKLVYKWLSPYTESSSKKKGLTLELLKEHGFI